MKTTDGRWRSWVAVALVGMLALAAPTAANAAEVTSIPVGGGPFSVAVSPDGTAVYSANLSDRSVSRITNVSALTPTVTRIPLGVGPESVAVSPDSTVLYTANTSDKSVSRITNLDAATPTVTRIQVGGTPRSVAVSPDGTTVYTANTDTNTVSRITNVGAATPTVSSFSVGEGPVGVVVSSDGTVYTANTSYGSVSRVTNASSASPTVFDIDTGRNSRPGSVAVSPDGATVYATTDSDIVLRITRLSSSSPDIERVTVEDRTYSVAVSPDGSTVYVSMSGMITNAVLQMTNWTSNAPTVTSIPVGRRPFSVAVSPDGSTVYTANYGEDTVSRISLTAAPVFTAAEPPAAVVGSTYSYTFTASGSPAPTFAVAAGDTLPAGLTLDATTGELSGTPTTAGTSTFRVAAKNSEGEVTSDLITFTVREKPVFTAAAPPAADVGSAYSYTFTASGFPAPSYSVAEGDTLPAGLTLNATTGEFSGTPAVAGSSTFRVVAENSAGEVKTDTITFIIREAPVLAAAEPPAATVGTVYSYTFTASGVPAPTFSLAAGDALPAGLTLNATTGELSGTPTIAGTSTFRVVAANAAGSDTSDPITFTVQAPPVFTAAAPPTATVGTVYSYTFAATGTPAPTFSLATADALPAGFTLDATTGQLTGTPSAAGSSTFRIVAANAVGTVTSDPITFVVGQAPAPSPSPTPSAVADSPSVSPAAALAVTGMAGVSAAFALAMALIAAGIVVLFTRRRRRRNNNPTP